jgi:hypothetical protein
MTSFLLELRDCVDAIYLLDGEEALEAARVSTANMAIKRVVGMVCPQGVFQKFSSFAL